MNLCDIILLNFLASMSVFVSINAGEKVPTNFGSIKENYIKLGNLTRAKRSGASMSLCSDIKTKLMKSGLPCAISDKYELHKQIGLGGCGTVLKGKEQSMCMVSRNTILLFLPSRLSRNLKLKYFFKCYDYFLR